MRAIAAFRYAPAGEGSWLDDARTKRQAFGMGRDSALFVASTSKLETLCEGWKPALPAPVMYRAENPFTGKMDDILIDTVDYADDDVFSNGFKWEQLAELPTLDVHIEEGMLTDLAANLGVDGRPCRRALSEPPGVEEIILELVPAFLDALATAPAEGKDWIVKLQALVRNAKPGERVYLVECW